MRLDEHTNTLKHLTDLISEEQRCATQIYIGMANTGKTSGGSGNAVLDVAGGKTSDKFVVLIIGAFSSGKSSMINALIGEDLLPHGFLPETAVLGELHYGEQKRVTLYPKKGKWSGGDEPFDIEATTEEITKYVSLSTDDAINSMEINADDPEAEKSDKRINAKFDKMIVTWPLDILKDGVILVDSPGINDPYSNDYIVESYLPHADAIVYVMDSGQAYTAVDKKELETINALGLKNIVTGYTFYDVAERPYRRNPERLKQFRDRLVSYMSRHTELGVDSIHFLDSMSGLDAKLDNDPSLWRKSGYDGFEKFLSKYLIEGKGRDQVKNLVNTIVIQANTMSRDAERFNSAASQDVDELDKRIEEAQSQLQMTRSNSYNTGRNYRNRLENYLPDVERMARTFLAEELPRLVDLEDFEPETKLPDGPRRLWPFGEGGAGAKAKAIQDECQDELTRRMNLRYKEWFTQKLGGYLKNAVTESTRQINPELQQIAKELTNITDLASGFKASEQSNMSNIAVGVAFGLLTGDWLTASTSAIYGKRAMARNVVYQLGAGVGLGVLALAGAPITLPVIAVTFIGTSIAAILTGDNKGKVNRIKAQVVSDFRKSFKDSKAQSDLDKMIEGIMDSARKYLNAAATDMEAALAMDIKGTEQVINQIIETNNMSLTEKNLQIAQRNEAVQKLSDIKKSALAIGQNYNIEEISMA